MVRFGCISLVIVGSALVLELDTIEYYCCCYYYHCLNYLWSY